MPGKKKKFIDKKSAVTFSLVHRSQRDPLQADDESSKFVLQQVDNPNNKSKQSKVDEQHKYGIYYEDDYDYLQHLRAPDAENAWELNQAPAVTLRDAPPKPQKSVHFDVEDLTQGKPHARLQLPANVFASEQEEDIGLLNRAAPISGPRLDLDPDIVAAMDDDFDFGDPDNELEDDFVMFAQSNKSVSGPGLEAEQDDSDDDDSEGEESGEDYDSDDLDDDDDQRSFSSEETKSRFTNYSLTSSVMKRNDGLTLLDDRFEKIYEEYDDLEIGALDQDEIEGHMPEESLVLQQAMQEFEEATRVRTMNELEPEASDHRSKEDGGDDDEEEEEEMEEEVEKEEMMRMYIEEKKERWDCESILSTYSTLYNHPATIKEPSKQRRKKGETNHASSEHGQIKLSQKSGMPLNVLPSCGPTRRQQEREEREDAPAPVIAGNRKKGVKESAEEKRERKKAVQQARRERRVEKKANKEIFKQEEIRQEKVMQNVRQNMQGIKIL